ncbi:hypothetical protein ACIHFE_09905 [Streptomyces sp. NPDC052396]
MDAWVALAAAKHGSAVICTIALQSWRGTTAHSPGRLVQGA